MSIKFFCIFSILVLTTSILQCLTVYIIGKINTKIRDAMSDVVKHIAKNAYDYDISREQEPFLLLDIKRKKLGFLTKLITYFEIFFFSLLTVLLYLRSQIEYFEIVKTLAIAVSGWIALKIFGNFQQWSGAVFGRATFYSFLIGSFLNIGSAVFIGWLAVKLLVS